MRAKRLNQSIERTYALIFETGDNPIELLTQFAENEALTASRFTAIGAFSEATLAYFDWETKAYVPIHVQEQVEVLALLGDIALDGSQPKVHAHVVLGTRDGTARGGHLTAARVRPTLEVMLEEAPRHLRKKYDPASGLMLIDLDA